MKKVIVFQHVHYEDLEKIEEYLLKKDLVIEKIKLYENQDIPKDLQPLLVCQCKHLKSLLQNWRGV